MGSVGERLLVGAAVLGLVVVALVAPADPAQDAWDIRLSSYHNSPRGVRGLYLMLDELGIRVDRRLSPLERGAGLPDDEALVLLAPIESPTPAELHALGDWLEDGGTLVYAARNRDDRALDSLGLQLAALEPGAEPAAEPAADPAADGCAAPGGSGAVLTRRAYPTVEHAWTRGVDCVGGFRRAFADSSAALLDGGATTLLATRAGEPVVVAFRHGRGTVLAWSDGGPLSNRAIRDDGGAATLFARAAAALTGNGARLAFDEYHQGYRGEGSVVAGVARFLGRSPAGHALLQVGMAGLLLLLLYGRRLGDPLPSPRPDRRSPLEHVDALAAAYGRAGARGTARRLLVGGLARRIGREPPGDPDEEARLLATLERQRRLDGDRLARLRDGLHGGERTDLTALARDIDDLIEEVGRL